MITLICIISVLFLTIGMLLLRRYKRKQIVIIPWGSYNKLFNGRKYETFDNLKKELLEKGF